MKTAISFINKHFISIVLVGVIFYLSTYTGDDMPKVRIEGIDKIAHFLMYFALSFSLSNEEIPQRKIIRLGWIFLFPSLYGGALELVQEWWFPPRTGDWIDWGTDIVGAGVGSYIGQKCRSFRIIRKIFRR